MDIFKSYKLKNDDVPVWAAEPFRSTILLTDKQFDIKDLKANLEKDWNILITDEVVDEKIIRFIYNDYVITIEHHLDNLDRETMLQNSTTNYFWDEAIIAALQYESELRISVYPKKHTAVEAGSFASQVNASAVKLENASAINIVGTVYEPSFYRDAAARVDDHEFPVLAQVFIRIYENDESMLNAYTYGLEKFGKQEIELLNSSLDLYELFNLIRNICADVINEKPNLFSEQINLSRCGKHFTFEESASNIFAVDTMKITVQNQV